MMIIYNECAEKAKFHMNGFTRTLVLTEKIFCWSKAANVGKKVKSAYGPMWPRRPELIPVSVA